MFLTRELTPLSLAQIAREFDRDHSTVLHALRTVEQRNEPGSDLAGDIHDVRAVLGELGPPDLPTGPPPHPEPGSPQA
jgi:chromosomal replication initiator protein